MLKTVIVFRTKIPLMLTILGQTTQFYPRVIASWTMLVIYADQVNPKTTGRLKDVCVAQKYLTQTTNWVAIDVLLGNVPQRKVLQSVAMVKCFQH
jgi:hypothetical protein